MLLAKGKGLLDVLLEQKASSKFVYCPDKQYNTQTCRPKFELLQAACRDLWNSFYIQKCFDQTMQSCECNPQHWPELYAHRQRAPSHALFPWLDQPLWTRCSQNGAECYKTGTASEQSHWQSQKCTRKMSHWPIDVTATEFPDPHCCDRSFSFKEEGCTTPTSHR